MAMTDGDSEGGLAKRRAVAALLLASLVAGLAFAPPWFKQRELFNAVGERLYDPESARFRDVQAVRYGYCGEVNARNRLGGYVGFRKFWATPPSGVGDGWIISIDDEEETEGVAAHMCARLAGESDK